MSAIDSLRHHPALSHSSNPTAGTAPLRGASTRSTSLARSHFIMAQRRYEKDPSARTLSILKGAKAHLEKIK